MVSVLINGAVAASCKQQRDCLSLLALQEDLEEESLAAHQQMQFILYSYDAFRTIPIPRGTSLYAQRLRWKECSDRHVQRGTFERRLRMPKQSFDKLLRFISRRLIVSERQANRRGGPIIPELCLYCTLLYI